jgi:GNAT superfamily N-acetyltransferase
MTTTPLVPRPSQDPSEPRWIETLRDRTTVLIRPLVKTDREAERAFIEGLSAESRRFRFLGSIKAPSERLLDRLTNVDQVHDVAFVAVVHEGASEHIVGVARYSADTAHATCECAVTVDDEWHGRGLGTVLMRHLIEVARARGIRRMESIDSADNIEMRDLASFLGFHTSGDPEDARQVIHRLDLGAPQ